MSNKCILIAQLVVSTMKSENSCQCIKSQTQNIFADKHTYNVKIERRMLMFHWNIDSNVFICKIYIQFNNGILIENFIWDRKQSMSKYFYMFNWMNRGNKFQQSIQQEFFTLTYNKQQKRTVCAFELIIKWFFLQNCIINCMFGLIYEFPLLHW